MSKLIYHEELCCKEFSSLIRTNCSVIHTCSRICSHLPLCTSRQFRADLVRMLHDFQGFHQTTTCNEQLSGKGKGKGICLESRHPRYTCSSDFTFPLAVVFWFGFVPGKLDKVRQGNDKPPLPTLSFMIMLPDIQHHINDPIIISETKCSSTKELGTVSLVIVGGQFKFPQVSVCLCYKPRGVYIYFVLRNKYK